MIRFGTGGWRDIIGENFTFENVRRFAQGISNHLFNEGKNNPTVIIGYDNRFMAEEFAKAAAEVFAANGINVALLTPSVPTPMVNFVTVKEGAAAGLTFTASHNPYIYNGIKYVREGGLPVTQDITSVLEDKMNGIPVEEIKQISYQRALEGGLIKRVDYHDSFMTFIENQLDMEAIKKAKLNVLYDPMFGTGVNSILTLLIDARCQLNMIHDKMDPLFGGRVPAPTEETLWRLVSMMKESDYDIGIATDGDADRIAIIDETGSYAHANEILVLLYYYLVKYKGQKGSVVRNVATTHLLDRIAEDFGYHCYEKPVGFKHIAEGMTETDAILGGESSGGITIKGHLLEKDAILSAGLLLEMLAVTNKTLGEIRQEIREAYGQRFYGEYNYSYSKEQKESLIQFMDKLNPELIYDKKLKHFKDIDGLKWEWEDESWCCVRFSGTEPVLRIMVESIHESEMKNIISRLTEILDNHLLVKS